MKRYVLVGASSRALGMFARPIAQRFTESAQLVGIYDTNQARAQFVSRAAGDAPVFADFATMVHQAQPDSVIVATIDRYHHDYIIAALEMGCDVISEKPMTIDAEKCRAILAAEQRTGRKVTVIFNMRSSPYLAKAKELLREGAVGQVLSAHLEWFLDRRHGADYFRRWHRRKENSGGLLVHKATHHFDMVNWCLDDEPESVYALGQRRVYGPTRAERGERCSTCQYASTCEFYVDYQADQFMRDFYFEPEREDGYKRDGCVFSPEIDIEDTMSLTVRYTTGTLLSYSLVAYSPYEGWRLNLTGTDGRMELHEDHSGPLAGEADDHIDVYTRTGEKTTYSVPKIDGVHGGSDELLAERLFGATEIADPLGQMAGSRAGAMSMLIGVAGNSSITSGKPVAIDTLLR